MLRVSCVSRDSASLHNTAIAKPFVAKIQLSSNVSPTDTEIAIQGFRRRIVSLNCCFVNRSKIRFAYSRAVSQVIFLSTVRRARLRYGIVNVSADIHAIGQFSRTNVAFDPRRGLPLVGKIHEIAKLANDMHVRNARKCASSRELVAFRGQRTRRRALINA